MSDERTRSPRRGMCAAVLGLEAVVLGLTTPIMVSIAGVGLVPALVVGIGLAAACVLVAGTLRREWAYLAGWAIQVAAVALGLVVPPMFFLGGLFAALWATADLLGQRIERERAAAFAAYDAQRGSAPDS
jgi:hypothetical protein